jgi:hypothetical protein
MFGAVRAAATVARMFIWLLCCIAGVSVQYSASSVMSSNSMTIAVSTAASTDAYYKLTYMYRCGISKCHV